MSLKYPKVVVNRSVPPFNLTRKVEIIILRKGEGQWVHGRWVDGLETEFTIEANVQPAKGYELIPMPEADRSKDWIKVYSVDRLNSVQEGDAIPADIVIWEGNRYQVYNCKTYRMGVLDHTKSMCVRLPETPQDQASYPDGP